MYLLKLHQWHSKRNILHSIIQYQLERSCFLCPELFWPNTIGAVVVYLVVCWAHERQEMAAWLECSSNVRRYVKLHEEDGSRAVTLLLKRKS